MAKSIEELLETPCWIIDILPKQVPRGSDGQYFVVEDYFRDEPQRADIKKKHVNVILKLNCYEDVFLDEEEMPNPSPYAIAQAMCERHTIIRIGESLIVSEPDDTYLSLYNPDEQLLNLIEPLAASEGLFVWLPPESAPGLPYDYTEGFWRYESGYKVVLVDYGFDKKQVVKRIRSHIELSLKEAIDLLNRLPITLKEGCDETEAYELKREYESVGAVIALEDDFIRVYDPSHISPGYGYD